MLRLFRSPLGAALRAQGVRGSGAGRLATPWASQTLRGPVGPLALATLQQTRNATLNQMRKGNGRIVRKEKDSRSPHLERCPLKKGVVMRVMILKPKKPNSAQRKAARVRLSNGEVVSAYIPGIGHNCQEHSVVYVRGGRSQDLPGVKYHLVRGAMDLAGVANRATSRSKYGVKKPQAKE